MTGVQTCALPISLVDQTWHDTGYNSPDNPPYEGFPIERMLARYIRLDISETSAPASHIFQATVAELEAIGSLPGDANGDGVVSDADYTIWADHYGATDATWAMGDFNGSGEVTEADYTIWADNYSDISSALPEPATLGLLALVGALTALHRRR